MSGQQLQLSPAKEAKKKSSLAQQYHEHATTAAAATPVPTTNSPSEIANENLLPSMRKATSSIRSGILRKQEVEVYKSLAPHLSNLHEATGTATILGPVNQPSRQLLQVNKNGKSSENSTSISAFTRPDLDEIGDRDESLPLPTAILDQPLVAEQVALKSDKQVNKRKKQQKQQEHDCKNYVQEANLRKNPRKQLENKMKRTIEFTPLKTTKSAALTSTASKSAVLASAASTLSVSTSAASTSAASSSAGSASACSASATSTSTASSSTIMNNNDVSLKKPQSASLLNSYRQTWKSTHNHYLQYTDVKPKAERRPTIIDLANQKHVMQKINGWKIHHLSTQMDDICDLETQVYDKLGNMLKLMETKDSRGYDKDFNRINELIKGNMQRSKILNDSTAEAKKQVMKIFDHKEHVADIIQRCASKRNFKKRDK